MKVPLLQRQWMYEQLLHATNQCIYVIENKIVETVLFIICTVQHYWFYQKAHVQFIFLLVCPSETHVWGTNECICAMDHYQTAAANETAAPVCTACPPGSTTDSKTNSSACGKYNEMFIPIPRYFLLNGFRHW